MYSSCRSMGSGLALSSASVPSLAFSNLASCPRLPQMRCISISSALACSCSPLACSSDC